MPLFSCIIQFKLHKKCNYMRYDINFLIFQSAGHLPSTSSALLDLYTIYECLYLACICMYEWECRCTYVCIVRECLTVQFMHVNNHQ